MVPKIKNQDTSKINYGISENLCAIIGQPSNGVGTV